MTIKMFIMFIIGDTTLLLLDLCVTLGWAKIATIVVICCHVVPEASSFFTTKSKWIILEFSGIKVETDFDFDVKLPLDDENQ